MSFGKILLIVGGVVLAAGIIIGLFVLAIGGFIVYTIGNSEAANHARSYLRTNEVLKRDIGEVKDFGSFVTGQVKHDSGDGEARLQLKVYGEKKTVNASVDLAYRGNRGWRVTGASYDSDGKTIDLMQPYEPQPSPEH
jgi:hypothetical protein